jgi:hypothetical protein
VEKFCSSSFTEVIDRPSMQSLCQAIVVGVFFAPLELTGDKDQINRSVIDASEAAGNSIVLPDGFQKRATIRYESP